MPVRALFDHGCQTKLHCLCPGVKRHIKVTPPPTPGLQCHPLFVCICMLNNQHVTYRQTICKHAKTTEAKQKNTLVLSNTTGICNHIQSTQPTLIPFFFLSLSSEPTSNTECRRTADSNSFSCSQWVLQTFSLSILTLISANEQRNHVLSKDPQTGGNIDSSHSFAAFHKRADAMQSQVMTTNLTRHILYNLCFSYHLHYFEQGYF